MLVLDSVATQHEHGDVHHHEGEKEKHHGRAGEGVEGVFIPADSHQEDQGYGGREEDGDPGRLPLWTLENTVGNTV
jgi:hypothetical protein